MESSDEESSSSREAAGAAGEGVVGDDASSGTTIDVEEEQYDADPALEAFLKLKMVLHTKLVMPQDVHLPPYRLLGRFSLNSPELWGHSLAALAAEWCNAYLNTSGGMLILGVEADGTIEGMPINGHHSQMHSLMAPFFASLDAFWPAVGHGLVTTALLPVCTATADFEPYYVLLVRVKKGPYPCYLNSRQEAYAGDHVLTKLEPEEAKRRMKIVNPRGFAAYLRCYAAEEARRRPMLGDVLRGGKPYMFHYSAHWSHPPLTLIPEAATTGPPGLKQVAVLRPDAAEQEKRVPKKPHKPGGKPAAGLPQKRDHKDSDATKAAKPCKHFAKGNCRNGGDCKYLHGPSPAAQAAQAAAGRSSPLQEGGKTPKRRPLSGLMRTPDVVTANPHAGYTSPSTHADTTAPPLVPDIPCTAQQGQSLPTPSGVAGPPAAGFPAPPHGGSLSPTPSVPWTGAPQAFPAPPQHPQPPQPQPQPAQQAQQPQPGLSAPHAPYGLQPPGAGGYFEQHQPRMYPHNVPAQHPGHQPFVAPYGAASSTTDQIMQQLESMQQRGIAPPPLPVPVPGAAPQPQPQPQQQQQQQQQPPLAVSVPRPPADERVARADTDQTLCVMRSDSGADELGRETAQPGSPAASKKAEHASPRREAAAVPAVELQPPQAVRKDKEARTPKTRPTAAPVAEDSSAPPQQQQQQQQQHHLPGGRMSPRKPAANLDIIRKDPSPTASPLPSPGPAAPDAPPRRQKRKQPDGEGKEPVAVVAGEGGKPAGDGKRRDHSTPRTSAKSTPKKPPPGEIPSITVTGTGDPELPAALPSPGAETREPASKRRKVDGRAESEPAAEPGKRKRSRARTEDPSRGATPHLPPQAPAIIVEEAEPLGSSPGAKPAAAEKRKRAGGKDDAGSFKGTPSAPPMPSPALSVEHAPKRPRKGGAKKPGEVSVTDLQEKPPSTPGGRKNYKPAPKRAKKPRKPQAKPS